EMRALPRQVEMEPGATEPAPLPRIEVRNADHEQALGSEESVDPREIRNRIRDVLQRVPHDDGVEGFVLELRRRKRADVRVDALLPRGGAGFCRWIDAAGPPPSPDECRSEIATAAAYVEQVPRGQGRDRAEGPAREGVVHPGTLEPLLHRAHDTGPAQVPVRGRIERAELVLRHLGQRPAAPAGGADGDGKRAGGAVETIRPRDRRPVERRRATDRTASGQSRIYT